jgi:drug/metabolite transporter (DMT)-like permease
MTRVSGIGLGFIGVVVLAAPWRSSAAGGSVAGIGACLLAATCYAARYVYARRFLAGRGLPPLVLAAGQLTIGAFALGLAAPVVARQAAAFTPSVVATVLVLGVLSTGAAYVLNYRLIQDEGATAASMANYLTPIVAIALGALILGELVTWNVFAGGALILLGVMVAEGRLSSGRHLHAGQRESGLDRAARHQVVTA